MTTDIKQLPLPSVLLNWPHPTNHVAIRDYARANVAHATAPLQAEIEALRAEVDRRTERVIVHRGQALACSESAHAAFTAEKARAERLAEALLELCNVIDGHEVPVAVEGKAAHARAALRGHDQEGKDG